MNNKFWDSPAWTMGHRKDRIFSMIQYSRKEIKARMHLGLAIIILQVAVPKSDQSTVINDLE